MQSAKGDNVQHIDLDTAKNVWPFSSSFPLHMTRTRPCNDVRLTCEDCFFFFIRLRRWIINDIYRICESWEMMEALFSRSPMVCKEHFLEEFCFSPVSQRTWESRTAAAESLLWPCGAWLEEEICLKACFFNDFRFIPQCRICLTGTEEAEKGEAGINYFISSETKGGVSFI